jgi:FG-GAP repeat protein
VTMLATAALAPLACAVPAEAAHAEAAAAASTLTGIGTSVAISGSTVVAGAPSWESNRGEVYVYLRHGKSWTQQAVLRLARGTANYQFGAAVAISGSTIVVGAPGVNGYRGLSYVYVRKGTSWHRQAVLSAKKPQKNGSFGASVGISGSTAVVGAPGQNLAGQVMVFSRHGTTWSRPATLPGPARSFGGYSFGQAVAVSGSRAVVGWPYINASGLARVFSRASATIWNLEANLSEPVPEFGAAFGLSVAISGAVIAVGAPNSGTSGAAVIFTRSKGSWGERYAPQGFGGASQFGASVAVSGSTVIVGAPAENGGGTDDSQGDAHLYQDISHKWAPAASITGPSPSLLYDNLFGRSVGISGGTVAIGAPGVGNRHGAVYIYVGSGSHWVKQATL